MTYAVIMAGGIGSRFWPLSRRSRPKQLLKIFGDKTLIQETVDRLSPLISTDMTFIVTVEDQIEGIRKSVPALQRSQFIAEPEGRNTAPCIALAAVHIAKTTPSAVIIFLPADHRIEREEEFRQILALAITQAQQDDTLVTIGIRPTRPETGYGYIQYEMNGVPAPGVYRVRTFAEKPDRSDAEMFLRSGDFLWNAGIFVVRADTLLEEFRRYLPDFHHDLMKYSQTIGTRDEMKARKHLYAQTKPISFDKGIMEHAKNVLVIPAEIGWSDVGNWSEVKRLHPSDQNNNAVLGDGEFVESNGCYIHSTGHYTAVVGLENIVVVHTDDATLVCHIDKVQEVREVVAALNRERREKLL